MVTFCKETFGGIIEGKAYIYKEGHCLSDDTKPTEGDLYNGSKLLEMDTGKTYYYDFDNATWLDGTEGV